MPERVTPKTDRELWSVVFGATASSPFSWRLAAAPLWRAGNHLLDLALQGSNQSLRFLRSDTEFPADERSISPAPGDRANAIADSQMLELGWMLIGLALENLAKGLLIRRNPGLVLDTGRLSRKLTQHALTSLVEQGLRELDPQDMDLLAALTSSVPWRGRYPVPRSSKEWAIANRLRLTAADREIAESLFHRLVETHWDRPSLRGSRYYGPRTTGSESV